jgi:hypothetical protein
MDRQLSYESDEKGDQNSGESVSVVQVKQKKKKGRPRKDDGKKKVVHEYNDDVLSDKTLYEEMDVDNEVTQVRKDRGLSDDEGDADEVECDGADNVDGDSDNDDADLMDGVKFPTF